MTVATLLDRLDGVRQTALDRWIAICPAHEDRSPSLSIREIDDGKTLVQCFGGCSALDVLDAVGLDWPALFPPNGHKAALRSRSTIPARDLLVILDHELTVAVLILHEIVSTRKIGASHFKRLLQASARVSTARVIANPAKAQRHEG
jgi:hypothetical protein